MTFTRTKAGATIEFFAEIWKSDLFERFYDMYENERGCHHRIVF